MAIDLFCGLGGWTEGFLSEGYDVIGFDIEARPYPGQLVLQDVLTLHGSQFKNAAVIVASPPCQKYSYMAMPWTRAKELAAWYRESSERIGQLTALFDACFRIQREACEAAGRYIPLVVENVKGAQPWVGRAAWHYGSFYLWGDVPALMPLAMAFKSSGMNWSDQAKRGQDFTRVAGKQAIKNGGGSWFAVAHNTESGHSQNPDGRKLGARAYQPGAVIPNGTGATSWFFGNTKHELRGTSSGSHARKAASAQIAKIPFELARHVAHVYKP